jgi:ubiquinone/menaquinone biosynthesis C-methylase UbiE
MTIEWFDFWNKSKDVDKLDCLFETNFDVARSILYQLNAKKSDILVEFGCGTGKLLSLIEKSVTASIGLDFSKSRTSVSKAKCSEFINTDCFDCKLKDNVFDKVFSFSLFNFLTLDESIATLEEMVRITKKDGIILIADILKDDFERVFYFKVKDENISCPKLSFHKPKVFQKIINNIDKNLETIVYDTNIENYKNNDLTFNVLIHKQ